jgi:hypothetical protein
MQDIQNIPNPDVNSTVEEGDFGNHSDIEQEKDGTDIENIPLPPDEKMPAPIEEPPDTEKPPIDEDNPHPGQLV